MKNDIATMNDALISQLKSDGLVEQSALDRALIVAEREGARLDKVLLRLGLTEEAILLPALCAALDVDHITLEDQPTLDVPAVNTLTANYLSTQIAAPVRLSDGALQLAMADPGNRDLLTEIEFHLDTELTPLGATTALIRGLLAKADRPEEADEQVRDAQTQRDTEALRRSEIDGPVIKFVQEKLTDAVMSGASDVHFESTEDGFTLRFRINGLLVPQRVDMTLNPASVLARLKVMAKVNVAERRLPQDGRMDAIIAGRAIDFRFSSLPTQWGESIVARVLDPKALRLGWDKLGFEADIVERLKTILERPSGLFLVTGPTGSGKTTTLYTAIAHLNTSGRKIVTVEDPVEYNMPGVQQVQVHEEIGLSFARVLRGVLRHDPNVILIGEIRDAETAEIAVRAAQVGRLVLSTLHTSSAAGAVTRLVDLGVPEFLVRDTLHGVLGQELLVTPCRKCGGAGCGGCDGSGIGERRLRVEMREG